MTDEEIQDWKAMWDNAESITLPQKDYDALVERLDKPPTLCPKVLTVLKKRPPWQDPAKQ